jgi:pimeloyl-ACP methyl ester carboxylesterase
LDISIDELKKTRVTKEFLYGILSRRKSENWELSETIEQASQALLENEWARNLFFEDQLYITSEEQRIKIQSATGSFDSRSEVKNIKCPTLVIGSDNDIIAFVEHSHYLHEQISGSELVILKSSNHVPCLDRYEEFNKLIIDFFNDNN